MVSEQDFDRYLDDIYEEIKIGSLSWSPAEVLKKMDPIAYRTAMSEYGD